MKKFLILLFSLLLVFALVSCGDDGNDENNENNNQNNGENGGENGGEQTPGEGETPPNDDGGDDSGNSGDNGNGGETPTPPPQVGLNPQAVKDALATSMNVFTNDLAFTNTDSYIQDTTLVNVANIATGDKYEIKEAGVYRITGTNDNARIYVNADGKNIILIFDNLNLSCSSGYPTVFVEKCKETRIVLKNGTENTLTDARNNGENGVLRVKKGDLTISGTGTLNITANKKYAISNTKTLTIAGGTYNITSVEHGIYGKEGLRINGGIFNINAQKAGFKSGDDNASSTTEAPEPGSVIINSCNASITSGTDGINCYGDVTINGGKIVVNAGGNGIDAQASLPEIPVGDKSYSAGNATIQGGVLVLNTEKNAIKVDGDVSVTSNASVKIVAIGNGIEGNNVTISTTGVIYIQTYYTFDEDETGKYVLINGEYVFDENFEQRGVRYSRRECRGIEATETISVEGGTIGISSYDDCFNANTSITVTGGTLTLNTAKDTFDAPSMPELEGQNVTVIE